MFNLGTIASNMLNSIDNAAKETLEEPKLSATALRSKKKKDDSIEIDETYNIQDDHGIDTEDNLFASDNNSINSNSTTSATTNTSNAFAPKNLPSSPMVLGDPYEDAFIHSENILSTPTNRNSNIPDSYSSGTMSNNSMNETGKLPPLRPNSSANKLSSSGNYDIEQELRKSLKKKNQEIEKLNRECLELEEQTNALKQEVQEAWSSYKQAQEKAILIESDLQDEIKLLTKSKNDDKQQLLVQYNKLKDELAASMQQVTELNNEKDELSKQLLMNNDINSQWATRVTELEELLNDARNNTVQGVQNLRDELRTSQLSLETLRNEHLTLIRQNEKRQSELEQENFSLTKSISSMQKELSYYKNSSANSDRNNDNYNNSNEYISMQQEIVMLSEKLNTETEKLNESERLIKQLQCEVRANQNNFDDERSRAKHLIDDLNNKIAKLEDKNRELKRSHKTFDNKADGYNSTNSMIETVKSTDDIDLETYYALAKEVHELRQQSENLSKMLLKKQGIVNDLQAERSALKSRLLDLQTRCEKAEQEVINLRNNEDYDLEENSYGDNSAVNDFSSSNTLQRRSSTTVRNSQRSGKVVTDLEKFGMKPSDGVKKAVNFIDTWALLTGRFLRSYPLARLGFVLYLLFLHLWVLIILIFHTNNLELDTEPKHSLNP